MTHSAEPPTHERPAPPDATGPKDAALDTARQGKDAALDTARQGKDAAADVAQHGKQAVQDVAGQARSQAEDLLGKSREQLSQQASVQKTALVDALRSVGDQLASMTEHSDSSGAAVDLVAQTRDRARKAADWLNDREPDQVLDELRGFGRQRTGAFLLGAVTAGIAAGRLTRGVAAEHTGGGTGTASGPGPVPTPSAADGSPSSVDPRHAS